MSPDLYLYLPPATELGQGNVFTGICDSVHRGVPASVHAGIPPPPEQSTRTEYAGRYGQRAGGTHPTGMQSCLTI